MIWQSWSDFFEMGGYGLYVWWSLIVTFGVMAGEVIALRRRRAAAVESLKRWVRINGRQGS